MILGSSSRRRGAALPTGPFQKQAPPGRVERGEASNEAFDDKDSEQDASYQVDLNLDADRGLLHERAPGPCARNLTVACDMRVERIGRRSHDYRPAFGCAHTFWRPCVVPTPQSAFPASAVGRTGCGLPARFIRLPVGASPGPHTENNFDSRRSQEKATLNACNRYMLYPLTSVTEFLISFLFRSRFRVMLRAVLSVQGA